MMKIFLQSKLFKILISFVAYLLFAFEWANNYKAAWYNNEPEETKYFHDRVIQGNFMGAYIIYGYLFMATFLIFLVFAIVYLVKKTVAKAIIYILISALFLSTYYVWSFSAARYKSFQNPEIINFVILVLFAVSIFKLSKTEMPVITKI